jgi:hypothetical protein
MARDQQRSCLRETRADQRVDRRLPLIALSYMEEEMARSKKPTRKDADDQAKRGIVLLGVLVAALAGLVYWASTSGKDASPDVEAGATTDEDTAAIGVTKHDAALRATGDPR